VQGDLPSGNVVNASMAESFADMKKNKKEG